MTRGTMTTCVCSTDDNGRSFFNLFYLQHLYVLVRKLEKSNPGGSPILSIERSSEGAHHVRVIRYYHRLPQLLFEQSYDAWIVGNTARKHQWGGYADAPEHSCCALSNCHVQSHGDIFGAFSSGHKGGGLAFGKNGAHAAYLYPPVGPERIISERFQRNLESSRHEFEELAGSGSAPVIHFEFQNFPGLRKRDNFRILPSDVQDGFGFRIQEP